MVSTRVTASTRRARGSEPSLSAARSPSYACLTFGVIRMRSLPALSARTAASPGDHFFAGAMFIPSVITTPWKPSWPRSTSVSSLRENVAGVPGSTALTSRWADITAMAPAPIPARNGGNARRSRSTRDCLITGSSVCESSALRPCPGKCLTAAPTPSACRPRTAPATWGDAVAGSAPKDREPITVLRVTSTSATGAKSRLMPIAASSAPAARQAASVSAGFPAAPAASGLGSSVTPSVIRVTTPYSWSVPIRNGAAPAGSLPAAARSPSVSARTCFGLSTFVVAWLPEVGSSALKPTRMTPPSRYFATISAGVSTPASARLPAAEPAETSVAELP